MEPDLIDTQAVTDRMLDTFDKWRNQRVRDKRILEALETDVKDRTAEQAALCAVAKLIGSGFCT